MNINGAYERVVRAMEEILVARKSKKILSNGKADENKEKKRKEKMEEAR